MELDYLRGQLKERQAEACKTSVRITAEELRLVGSAVQILARVLPAGSQARGIGATVHRLPSAL